MGNNQALQVGSNIVSLALESMLRAGEDHEERRRGLLSDVLLPSRRDPDEDNPILRAFQMAFAENETNRNNTEITPDREERSNQEARGAASCIQRSAHQKAAAFEAGVDTLLDELLTWEGNEELITSILEQITGGVRIAMGSSHRQELEADRLRGAAAPARRVSRPSQPTAPPQECPICKEEMDRQNTYALPCCHTYHDSCIQQWLQTGDDRCPVCRANVNS